MTDKTQDLSYLDKKQKEDLQRLKQFQSINSEIFPDRVLEKQDRLRYFYLNEIELERIKIDQKIVVREKDEALLRRLKPQVDAEGLIEPLTVEDLGNKMRQIFELSFDARVAMGLKGRKHMEDNFDETIVIDRYISTIQQTLNL